jgi:hypothetical protein
LADTIKSITFSDKRLKEIGIDFLLRSTYFYQSFIKTKERVVRKLPLMGSLEESYENKVVDGKKRQSGLSVVECLLGMCDGLSFQPRKNKTTTKNTQTASVFERIRVAKQRGDSKIVVQWPRLPSEKL